MKSLHIVFPPFQVENKDPAMTGFAIDRAVGVTIGYEPAARRDGVPGQDLSRQVIAVHDGRAYTLVFVPADESQGEVYREMEALYDLVVRSFRFLPQPRGKTCAVLPPFG